MATEPLPASTWNKIGLDDYETFSDHRHLIIYGQRTSDDRLVFGGRGAPYHFRSSTKPGNDNNPRVFAKLGSEARAMFPALRSATFTHAWGGALGVPRDWCASVGLSDGIGWAGGYVGDGVGTTNLAGRTLRDLILGRQTELTALPLGRSRLRTVGAGAAALPGDQCGVARDDAGRLRGEPHRAAEQDSQFHEPLPRRLTAPDLDTRPTVALDHPDPTVVECHSACDGRRIETCNECHTPCVCIPCKHAPCPGRLPPTALGTRS